MYPNVINSGFAEILIITVNIILMTGVIQILLLCINSPISPAPFLY